MQPLVNLQDCKQVYIQGKWEYPKSVFYVLLKQSPQEYNINLKCVSSGVWSLQAKYHTSLVNLLEQVCDLTMVKWGAQHETRVQGDKRKRANIHTAMRRQDFFFFFFLMVRKKK